MNLSMSADGNEMRDALLAQHEWATRKAEESIFDCHKSWQYNSILYTSWDLYAIGYKNAADCLVEHAANDNVQDIVVFPVMFLYRQYLELRIKELLLVLQMHRGVDRYIPHSHDLHKLWSDARILVEEVYKSKGELEENIGVVESIEKRILEFHHIDRGSFAFRYPVDKSNTPSLRNIPEKGGQLIINLIQVRDILDAVAYFLDGLSVGLSAEIDYVKEMELEYLRAMQEEEDHD